MNPYIIPGIIKANKDLAMCLEEAGIKLSDYALQTRKREILEPRQAIMAFAHIELNWTQKDAGSMFGLDHCTTINSTKIIRGELDLLKLRPNMVKSNRIKMYLKLVEIKKNNA